MQIVVAWTEESQEVVKAGRVDIGEAHKFKTVQLPKACMWLNKGTEADAEKARKYAAIEGRSVFCYEGEKDPLGRAKKDVLNGGVLLSALEVHHSSLDEGTADAWMAYDMVANDLARRGLKGEIGDPLPNLISSACDKLIQDDTEAFKERVRMSAYTLSMSRV